MDAKEFDNEVVCRNVYGYLKRIYGGEPYSPAVAELTCFVSAMVSAERARAATENAKDFAEARRVLHAAITVVQKRADGRIPTPPPGTLRAVRACSGHFDNGSMVQDCRTYEGCGLPGCVYREG